MRQIVSTLFPDPERAARAQEPIESHEPLGFDRYAAPRHARRRIDAATGAHGTAGA